MSKIVFIFVVFFDVIVAEIDVKWNSRDCMPMGRSLSGGELFPNRHVGKIPPMILKNFLMFADHVSKEFEAHLNRRALFLMCFGFIIFVIG